jgi:hypothetical protein
VEARQPQLGSRRAIAALHAQAFGVQEQDFAGLSSFFMVVSEVTGGQAAWGGSFPPAL